MTDRWRVRVELPDFTEKLTYSQALLSMGSCFAEYMASRLRQFKFQATVNPFGILYNPISIARGLYLMRTGYRFREKDLFEFEGLWYSYEHHGRFARPGMQETLDKIQHALHTGKRALEEGRWLFLTLGSAFVWEHREQQRVVANCHKQPARHFSRRRLSVQEIVETLEHELALCREQNKDLEVIFTVSPVRYTRDGFVESQRSKAALILATDALSRKLPYVHYFPAYELVIDELRDYRFYDRDRVHPSEEAVDYVWEKLTESLMDAETRTIMAEIQQIEAAVRHRAFHPASPAHQRFLDNQLAKIEKLENSLPFLDFKAEKEAFLKQKS